MTLKVEVEVSGKVSAATAAEIAAGKRAVTGTFRGKTDEIKQAMRQQIRAAGLGRGQGRDLAKALRGQTYPQRADSLNAKGVVFSVSRYKRRAGGPIDLVTVFEEGASIRPVAGRFLAIPTPAAGQAQGPGRGGPRKAMPSDFPEGTLDYVPQSRGADPSPARLVFKVRPEVTAFFLLRTARIRQRLALAALFEKLTADLDREVGQAWDLEARKA